jgi:hypothetical protein
MKVYSTQFWENVVKLFLPIHYKISMIKPCNSRNFYYFPLDPHLNHQNLDKGHYNFPVGKAIKKKKGTEKRKK